MLRVDLNVTWRDRLTDGARQSKLCPLSDIIKYRRVRFAGHYWKVKDKIVSEFQKNFTNNFAFSLHWQLTVKRYSRGRQAKAYIK